MTWRRQRTPFDNSPQYKLYIRELTRRSAMLDFLALYTMAAQEDIVGKIQFVNQANGFSAYQAAGWETYLTRLLGRCIRHHVPETGAVVKRRRDLVYVVDYRDTFLNNIIQIDKVLRLDWPHRPNSTLYREAGHNAKEYWKRSVLFEDHPEVVDAVYLWRDMFNTAVNNLQRVGISPWQGLEVRYGQPMSSWYYGINYGRYHAAEAYKEFLRFLELADEFLAHDDNVRLTFLMQDYNHDRAVRERDDPERAARIEAVRANVASRYTPHADAVVEQDSADLRSKFMDKLRARGKVE